MRLDPEACRQPLGWVSVLVPVPALVVAMVSLGPTSEETL
jgi:hypothetical protein